MATNIARAFNLSIDSFRSGTSVVRRARFCRAGAQISPCPGHATRPRSKGNHHEATDSHPPRRRLPGHPLHALGAADLLVVNARIFTANPQPFAEALAVEDGRILAVGDEAGLRALADGDSQVVDLGGKRLMPGLIDTHSHAVFGGLELAGADMGNEQVGLDELERRLRALARQRQGATWRHAQCQRHAYRLLEPGPDFRARFDHGEWADQPLAFIGSDHHTAGPTPPC